MVGTDDIDMLERFDGVVQLGRHAEIGYRFPNEKRLFE